MKRGNITMENKKWVAGWGTCENVTTQTIADHI